MAAYHRKQANQQQQQQQQQCQGLLRFSARSSHVTAPAGEQQPTHKQQQQRHGLYSNRQSVLPAGHLTLHHPLLQPTAAAAAAANTAALPTPTKRHCQQVTLNSSILICRWLLLPLLLLPRLPNSLCQMFKAYKHQAALPAGLLTQRPPAQTQTVPSTAPAAAARRNSR
jgi:hypothetical protein